MTAPIGIWRAAYLLARLRLRRMFNQIGSLSRYRMGAPDRKAASRASPVRGVFGALVALAMLGGFTKMAYDSIVNIERALGSIKVENAARTGVGDRANTSTGERSGLSFRGLPPAPGSVLAPGVLQGVTLEATLVLAAVLFMAIASRELVQPEWDLEWLITLPLPLYTLICSMLVERVVANSAGFIFLGTFLWALAWKCGYGWAALLPGAALTIALLFLVATIQVLVDTGLRLVLPPSRLRNLQAVIGFIAFLPLFPVWSLGTGNLSVLDWMPMLPDWAKWLPSGLAVKAIASSDVRSGMLWTAIMMAEVLVAVAVGAVLLQHQLRNGVAAAGVREAVVRTSRVARDVASASRPNARTMLSAVQRRELLLLGRDRTLFVQTLLLPATMVGLQVLFNTGNQALVSVLDSSSTLATIAFYLAALTVMQPAFRTFNAEGAALWILYSVPYSLDLILLQKAKMWAAVAIVYPVVIFAVAAITIQDISFQFVASAAVVLIGVPIFSMIAMALAVFACDPLAQEVQQRVRPTYLYLYMMLGSFYGYAIYANSIWQRLALMVLTALVAMALWQKARDQFDYLLDPYALPPSRVSVSDGLIAALAFFVLQALAVMVQTIGGRAVSGQIIWIAFCVAGASTYGVMRLIYWRTRTAGVPVVIGGDVPGALWSGLAGGVAASVCGIGYLELVSSMGLFASPRANPIVESALPVWLATLAIFAAPVFEEFIFRGLIFGGLRRSLGLPMATLASAAVFAIVHPPVAVIPVFIVGVCAALVYERTGALVAPMLVHALYNTAVLGFQWSAMH